MLEQLNDDPGASASTEPHGSELPACDGYASTDLVRALADVLQQRGISPETFLGGETALDADPAERSVSLHSFSSLISRAIVLTRDPALGLHCGLQASESSFGLMSPLVAHAPTLRHALALAARFHPLLLDGVRFRLTEHTGVAQLRCELDCDIARNRSFVELVVAGMLRTIRAFGCTSADIAAVRFAHSRPAYHHAYSVACAGAERFSQPWTGLEFAARALDRPHLHRHPQLLEVMLAQAELGLERLRRPVRCSEHVRRQLRSGGVAHKLDMAGAARALGISVRSLRRRLEEEGTSYRELSQAALHESACSLLRDRAVTLQAIASELGFANATAFHRAFRRWANLTPAEYRAQYFGASHVAATQDVFASP